MLLHIHGFFPSLFRKKSSRTITYDEFKTALGELSRKKYKEKTAEEAEAEVFKLIEGKAPIIAGVTVRVILIQSRIRSNTYYVMLCFIYLKWTCKKHWTNQMQC